jgi:hypothetical protein
LEYGIETSSGNNILPTGKKRGNFAQYYTPLVIDKPLSCAEISFANSPTDIKNIRILPNGNVNICRSTSIGNIFAENIEAIIEKYNPIDDPILSLQLRGGINEVLDQANVKGAGINPVDYYGYCDLCTDCAKYICSIGADV